MVSTSRSLTLLLLLTLMGCATPGHEETRTANPPFMKLWQIYSHCQSTDEIQSLLTDAALLNRYTRGPEREVPRLLRPVRSWIAAPVVRLAADPTAMAQACTLRAAEAAADVGWGDVAIELYRSILSTGDRGGALTYYAREAQAALASGLLEQSER